MRNKKLELAVNKSNLYQLSDMIPKSENSSALLEFMNQLKPQELLKINEPIIHIDETYVRYNEYGYALTVFTLSDILLQINFNRSYDWSSGTPEEIFTFLINKGMKINNHKTKLYIQNKDKENLLNICNGNSINKIEDILKMDCEREITNIASQTLKESKTSFKTKYILNKLTDELSNNEIKNLTKLHGITKHLILNDQLSSVEILLNKEIAKPDDYIDGFPIHFYSKTKEMLNLFLERGSNVYATSESKKSAVDYFADNLDPDTSNDLIRIVHKKINELDNKDPQSKLEQKNSSKNTLLSLVKKNKNKKHIEEFIKIAKLSEEDFLSIRDNDSNNLKQICIDNDAWAKIKLFSKIDDSTKNSRGMNCLDLLFIKDKPEDSKKAEELLLNLINNVKMNTNSIIKHHLDNNTKIEFPLWIRKDNANKIITELGGIDLKDDFLKEIQDSIKQKKYGYDSLSSKLIYNTTKLLITIANVNKEVLKIEPFSVENLLSKEHIKQGMFEYDKPIFKENTITNLKILFEQSVSLKENISYLMNRMAKDIVGKLAKSYDEISNDKVLTYRMDEFCKNSSDLVELLIKSNNSDICEFLTGAKLESYEKANPNISKVFHATILDNELKSKENNQQKKIKI